MKESVQHPVHGNIIYEESFWTGRKSLTVDGVVASRLAKNEFVIEDKKFVIKGSQLTGVCVLVDGEEIQVVQKTKWYEYILTFLPIVFLLIWGNVPALCEIFPVVGGALGGFLGALGGMLGLMFMKKTKSPLFKILIGLGAFAVTVLAAFVVAITILSALA